MRLQKLKEKNMSKWANNSVMDAALIKVATATHLIICPSQPADRAAALATALATTTMTPGDGNGDYTIADGDISGRKLTMSKKDNVSVAISDTATHAALIDGFNLLYVTMCIPQALIAGNTVSIPVWRIELADPV